MKHTSALCLLLIVGIASRLPGQPLPHTAALTRSGDLSVQMVAGIDSFLTRESAASVQRRRALWKPDYSSPEAYTRSLQARRAHLGILLGAVDARLPGTDLELVATTDSPALAAEGPSYRVYAVRWPVFEGVDAEGLLLQPVGKAHACVVALPDADWTPEMVAGLAPGIPVESQFARRLAENGCLVLIPTLIDRQDTWSGNPRLRMTNQPHREFIYRMAFEMGRHIIGYEVQKVLAAVDWFARDKQHRPIGVIGYGEGGLLALYSAALDQRIEATVVSGYFGPREGLWKEPIYRNVWALLTEFGDAELGMLIAPRTLILEHTLGPEIAGPPPVREGRSGAAPGRLTPVPAGSWEAVKNEADRVARRYADLQLPARFRQVIDHDSKYIAGQPPTLQAFLTALGRQGPVDAGSAHGLLDKRVRFRPALRQRRQFDQLCNYTQRLLRESEWRREQFWKIDAADKPQEASWQAHCQFYRHYLWEEVIGKLPPPELPANPRTRLTYDEPRWKGYDVMIDVYPDVFASGILLVPKDLKPGERRPVVVCQHGLNGRPEDVVNPRKKTLYYNSFGAQLADRGYIVYAPQNPYIGDDLFRHLQRKANPLKLSLFSFIVRQHERTLDWLAELPFVDRERIAFYGLSYGGKTAMRVPPLLERYALVICSGDFNDWIWKTVTVDYSASYMFSPEYEIDEFGLGNTFNYAEMAALIAPRAFMVERGHDDGVGTDERVAYEYAKVRRLYSRLGVPDQTAIEFFAGGHMINGQGTFAFLARHLRWPP